MEIWPLEIKSNAVNANIEPGGRRPIKRVGNKSLMVKSKTKVECDWGIIYNFVDKV